MLITCDNKGCMKTSNAQLNVNSLEVICLECRNPIVNISETMKRVLKSSGQVIREEKKAFTMGCNNCKANRQVVLNSKDETVCSICEAVINVHPAMRQAILEAGIKLEKQVKEVKKKARKVKSKK